MPEPSPAAATLATDGITVWRWRLDASDSPSTPPSAAPPAGELSADELERAERFYHRRDRRRFTAARVGLRRRLGAELGVRPVEVRFQAGPHGKPRLAGDGPAPLEFNLAHSGEWAVLAVARGFAVGIDLERQRPVGESDAIARRHYSEGERSRAPAPGGPDYERWFFDVWTAKEAALKLLGAGLALPLDRVETPAADGWATLPTPNSQSLGACWIHRLPAPPGYRAALACPTSPSAVRVDDAVV